MKTENTGVTPDAAYRLMAIDIDGTLLTSERQVTPRTLCALEAAVAAGVRIVLCTGRSFHSARPIAERMPASVSLVFHSGALIFESLNGRMLRAINLPREPAFEIVDYFRAEGFDPLVYDPVPESRHFWYEPPRTENEWRRRYIEASGERACMIEDVRDAPLSDLAQIGVAGRQDAIASLREKVETRWPETGVILSHSTIAETYWFLEVVPLQASKAQALSLLGETFGIAPEAMIGIGDNFNDLDMIQYAGLGVAMGNAPDGVKAVADVVAPSNDEEGVAFVIEKFLL
ncbi:MAG: HAD family phosphatase [candidate division Zixibacteria bacterium]|nr:HAD family phosphatase [candidate division Zixibacteria bacterium]